jgi:hypothetical protein
VSGHRKGHCAVDFRPIQRPRHAQNIETHGFLFSLRPLWTQAPYAGRRSPIAIAIRRAKRFRFKSIASLLLHLYIHSKVISFLDELTNNTFIAIRYTDLLYVNRVLYIILYNNIIYNTSITHYILYYIMCNIYHTSITHYILYYYISITITSAPTHPGKLDRGGSKKPPLLLPPETHQDNLDRGGSKKPPLLTTDN